MIAEKPKMAKKKPEIIPEAIEQPRRTQKEVTSPIRIKNDLIQMIRVIVAQRGEGSVPEMIDQVLRPQLTALYFDAIEKLKAEEEEIRRHNKDEITHLITVVRESNISRCLLSPDDRASLYLLAIYTGFRLGELASLTKKSFNFSNPTCPTVYLQANKAKNRKPVVQPFSSALVPDLIAWLATKTGTTVWPPSQWHKSGAASKMLVKDLEMAGIPIIDTSGRKIDFHALRTTYATLLVLSGVPLASAVRLMRHSDAKLTMNYYVQFEIQQLADEAQKIL